MTNRVSGNQHRSPPKRGSVNPPRIRPNSILALSQANPRGSRTTASLFTDAGYSTKTGHSAWGMYIAREGQRRETGDLFKSPLITCNNAAEIAALANSLIHAKNMCWIMPGDEVLLQTDSLILLGVLSVPIGGTGRKQKFKGKHKNKRTRIPFEERSHIVEMTSTINQIVTDMQLYLVARHVRGHNRKSGERRSAANHRADLMVRRAMRQGQLV